MNSEERLEAARMHFTERQMQYILDCKRLEEIVKPGYTYTYTELIKAIELAKNVVAYIAVKTAVEETTEKVVRELVKRVTEEGFVAVFSSTIEPLILREAQLISQRRAQQTCDRKTL